MVTLPTIAIGAGLLLAGGLHVKGLLQLKEHAKIEATPRLISAGFNGLALGVSISIANPTTQQIRLSPPQVTISYDEKELVSGLVPHSTEPDGSYTIKAKSTTQLAELRLNIALSAVAGLGQKLLAVVTNPGTPILLQVRVVTNLFIPPGIKKLLDTTESYNLARK